MNKIMTKTIFVWLILSGLSIASPVFANEYLAETKEIVFAPELQQLAADLNHDPVKIYNWVYENIEFEDYQYARKNALNVYWTKTGNEWDQSTLLITLMRLSGIQARYLKYSDESNPTYYANRIIVEALLSVENYRGYGDSDDKIWMQLIPWKKNYKVTQGLDLFPDNTIPAELDFDFDGYVTTIKQKTALETYEEQLQNYLDVHYPGKTLKDIGYTKTIIKENASVLPLSLPHNAINITEVAASNPQFFAEIPNEYKYKITFYLKREGSDQRVLEYDIYLPEVSTSRVVLDFIPYDAANAGIISPYQLITKTPDGAAQVKAVLKVGGEIVASSTFTTGEYFYDGQQIYEKTRDRLRKKVGTTIALGLDPLISSEKMIEKLKDELSEIPLDTLNDDFSKEEYLGRYLTMLMQTYEYRNKIYQKKIDKYFSMRRNYKKHTWMGRIYTFADDVKNNNNEKFAITDSIEFDYMGVYAGDVYDSLTDESVSYFSEIQELMDNMHHYTASYNEGVIFEDWQSTPGGSTIKAFMVAHEQNVPVVTLTQDDIENGHLYILENQTTNRYSDSEIQQIIEEINRDWGNYRESLLGKVTLPVQELKYEGATLIGRLAGPAYLFSIDHGNLNNGGGSVAEAKETKTTDFTVDSLDSDINSAFTTTSSFDSGSGSSGSGGSQTSIYSFNLNEFFTNRTVSSDGDPVDMLTGEFYQEEVADVSIKSVADNKLEIKRTYKSQLDYNGIFGYGWAWNHMDRLVKSNGNTLLHVNNRGVFSTITQHSNTSFTYPPGATYTLVFANNQYTLTEKDGSKKVFDENGLLLQKTDTNGNAIRFEYNAEHNISVIKDDHGKSLTLNYNANNKVISVTDGQGITTTYSYDEDDLIAYNDAEGNTTAYEYLKNQENPANNHNMSKYILPNGDYLELVYYKNDQVSHHTNKKGDTFNFQYSRYNQYSETWNEAGYYRKVFFNDNGDVIRIDKKDGTLERNEYDADHNVTAHTDANGYTTTYTYDTKRNMLTRTNALNETHTYEYHATFNKLTQETDPNGNSTSYAYDVNGNLIRKTDALLNETHYEYDSVGNSTKMTDALGNETINTYDITGAYLLTQTDARGNTTTYTYDSVGNITSTTNAIGNAQHTQYNKNNQVTEQRDENNAITTYEYDENKNLLRKTLANNAVYEYTYHTAKDIVIGNLLQQDIDPLGNAVHYSYDKLGNRTEVTDKNGNTTYYTYNELNKVTSMTDANGHSTYYEYDGLGNLVKESTTKRDDYDTLDIITTYTYDAAARLVSRTTSNGQRFDYEYDNNGNKTVEKHTINNEEVITRYTYNALNNPVEIVQGFGSVSPRTTTIEYDALQRKIRETNAIGVATRYVYDNNANLLQQIVEEAEGEGTADLVVVTNAYNTLNQLITQTDANNNSTTFAYDAKGQLINRTDALNNVITYHYDEVGNRTREDQPTGSSIQYRYNANNQLVEQTNALGHSQYFEYDANGNRIKTLDANGNATLFAYNTRNQPVAVTDSLGNTRTVSYDELGNRIAEVNEAGNITEYTYDINNNVIQQRQLLSGSDSLQTDFVYDGLNRLTNITDANGNTTTYSYTIFNERTTTTDALAQTITQTFDALGRIVSVTDAKGITHTTTYDALGRVLATTQASGTADAVVSTFTYDSVGNRLSMTEGVVAGDSTNAVTTHYTYDALSRVVTTAVSDSAVNNQRVASQTYDALGNVLTQTDGNGHTTQFVYDAHQQLTQQTNANGHSTVFTYDANGNLLSQTSAEGVTVVNEYDALNRIVVRQIGNAREVFEYDNASRITAETDFKGHRTVHQYDALGRILNTTKAQGTAEETTTEYTYDANSNLISMTDANGNVISYTYDALNRKTEHTFASGAVERYQYDANANLITTTQKDNTVVMNTYDNLNRLVDVEVDGIVEQEFGYDALSRLISTQDHNQGRQTHSVSYQYDALNNMTQTTQDGRVINTTYDAGSNLTNISANGFSVTNTYNSLNSLSHITANLSSIADIAYDNDNRRSQINTANGIGLSLSYDTRSRETDRTYTHTATAVYQQATAYDLNSNVVEETISENNQTVIKQYAYDAQNRLTQQQKDNDAANDHYFSYDHNGNIIATNHNGYSDNRQVNSDNHYTGLFGDNGEPNNTITYDDKGNITQYKDAVYTYDYANRLIETQRQGNTTHYTYDAENRRITKTTNGVTTTYIYDQNQVVQEYISTQTQPSISYLYADQLDDPIAFIKDSSTYYYLKDRIGSITAITDASGNIVERYSYNAFGIMTITDANNNVLSESAYGNTYTYTGRRFDAESGLYYYRNRMYSAELGRFMSEDPLGYIDGYNLYQYAHNNPLKYTDPMGTTAHNTTTSNSSLYPGGADFPSAPTPETRYTGPGIPVVETSSSSTNHFDVNERLGGVRFDSCPSGDCVNRLSPLTGINRASIDREIANTQARQELVTVAAGSALLACGASFVCGTAVAAGSFIESGDPADVAGAGRLSTTTTTGSTNAASPVNATNLNRQLTSQEIAAGHAFEKHVVRQGEFPNIQTRQQFESHIGNVLSNPSSIRYASDGRVFYIQESTGTIVVRNPNASDGGTAFQPKDLDDYVENNIPKRTTPF